VNNEDLDVKIIEPGHQINVVDTSKSTRDMVKLAEANGWEVKVGQSKFYEPPKVYKTGSRAGEQHGEKTVVNHWIQGVNRERKQKIDAVWHDGAFKYGRHSATIGLVNATQLKKFIKEEEENNG